MIKKLLFTLTAGAFGWNLCAQIQQIPALRFEAGWNNAQTIPVYPEGTYIGTAKPRTYSISGIRAGVSFKVPVYKGVNLEPGVFYVSNGYKNGELAYAPSQLFVSGTARYRFHSVEVPLNVGYDFDLSRMHELFFYAGPFLRYTLSGSYKFESDNFDTRRTLSFGNDTATDDFRSTELGLNAGILYRTPFNMYGRAQFGYGFTNITPGGGNFPKMNNIVWSLSIGYQLNFGKDNGPRAHRKPK